MFTECPECLTTFRLSAEDLRRAQGRVRCGECGTVFNALQSLAENPALAEPEPEPEPEPPAGISPSWLIDSGRNPPGDLEPDLGPDFDNDAENVSLTADEADNSDTGLDPAGLEEPVAEEIFEFDDDEDDDDGTILYIDEEPQPAGPANPAPAESAAAEPDADAFTTELAAALGDEATPGPDEDVPDFDETIWERIPGVALPTLDTGVAQPGTTQAAPDDQDADPGPEVMPEAPPVRDAGEGNEYFLTDDRAFEPGDIDADPVEPAPEPTTPGVPPAPVLEGRQAEPAAAPSPASPSATEPAPARVSAPASTPAEKLDAGALHDDALSVWVAEGGSTLSSGETAPGNVAPLPTGTRAGAQPAEAEDDLEFDVPAENWNSFFGTSAQEPQPTSWDPPQREDTAAADADDVQPSWQGDAADLEQPVESARRGWLKVAGCVLLIAVLAGQLLHYNRDALAAHPDYGPWVRQAYALAGQPLYPDWSLTDSYEIRGSEAVVGESGTNIMDIRAQIAAVGEHATGLPRLRVVLRDRWANPVAASDFSPAEYANRTDLPADGLLQPGAVVPARVSIVDPGSGVQGFELELCLPRRNTGLECTDEPGS